VFDPKALDDLARKLADSVPGPIKQLQGEMEQNFHAVLQTALDKMNLVTREEFEVQTGVLARTRAKLEALEERLAELEANPAPPDQAPDQSDPISPTRPDRTRPA